MGANPPGASPDEPSHYVKALATASGQAVGERFIPTAPDATIGERFNADAQRRFTVAARLAPDPRWACNAFTLQSAACVDGPPPPVVPPAGQEADATTIVGTYPPVIYAVLGAAARPSPSAVAALYAMRAASAVASLVLLAIAWCAARRPWTRAAIVSATSPMVVFLAASSTTSGIEIAAAVAHATVVLAVSQEGATRRLAVMYAISGVALASARSLGPLWIAGDIAVLVVLVGWRRVLACARSGGRAAGVALTAVVLAGVVTAAWTVVAVPRVPVGLGEAVRSWGETVELLGPLLHQRAGVFGWLDTPVPQPMVWSTLALDAVLVGAALVVASGRERLAIACTVAALALVTIAVDVLTQIPASYRVQFRYVMPLFVVVPLLAAHVLDRRLPRAGRGFAGVVVAASAVLHPLAWLTNSRQSAVGIDGATRFFAASEWAPAGGWGVWIALVATGTVVAGVGLALDLRARDSVPKPQGGGGGAH